MIGKVIGEISAEGISPIPADLLPPQLLSIVYTHIVRQELSVKAGLEGSRELLTAALAGDLLETHRDFLPQFFNGEAP